MFPQCTNQHPIPFLKVIKTQIPDSLKEKTITNLNKINLAIFKHIKKTVFLMQTVSIKITYQLKSV